MQGTDFLESRIRELADRAYKNEYTTHTEFLSVSEQASFYDALKKLGVPSESVSPCREDTTTRNAGLPSFSPPGSIRRPSSGTSRLTRIF